MSRWDCNMQLPAHRSATMAFQFSDLPHDLMEAVFEALPSVYQIYKCSLVCRAWRGPALRVLERRRAAIIARSSKFQTWHTGSKPSPELRVFTEYAYAVDQCGPHRSVLHADGESVVWASEQQINLCKGKNNYAGFWIGPTSTVNSICAVGPNCIAATLHAYSDPWDDSLEAQTSLERGHSRHYLVVYSLATSDEVWHIELPLHSSYQGMSPIVVASPNADRLIVAAGTGLAHYRVSHRNDKGDPTAYFLAWRGGIAAGTGSVLLCGDKELFVGESTWRAVTVFDHDRPHAVARTLRNNPAVEDGVSSMCFVDKAQQHLCIATENGSLETRCAKYGTLLLRFPDLARRFVGNPQVVLTKDGDVLVSHRAYNTRDGMMRGWMAAIVPVVL